MNFLKIEREQFKNYSKEFRNTYIGGKLYIIFDWFRGLFAIGILFELGVGIYDGITGKEIEETSFATGGDIASALFLICAVISYYKYFKYLKEYIENTKK